MASLTPKSENPSMLNDTVPPKFNVSDASDAQPIASAASPRFFVFSDKQLDILLQRITSHVTLSPADNRSTNQQNPKMSPIPRPQISSALHALDSESLINHFPLLSRAVIIDVVSHKIHALDLYKLDSRDENKPSRSKDALHNTRRPTGAQRPSGSIKDYPGICSLLDPLLIYFSVLGAAAATSGNVNHVLAILDATAAYLARLLSLNRLYRGPAVLTYHMYFFLERQREMMRGGYTGVETLDGNLLSIH